MSIRTRRWNDPREPDDGRRILVCRFRPRALPRSQETWDEWIAALGPSRELHAQIHGKQGAPIAWSDFRARYLEEMKAERPRIEALAARVRAGETITLLCSRQCVDETRCHRTLLQQLLQKAVAR